MEITSSQYSESRFGWYVEGLVSVIGHADRAKPLGDYCQGLLLPCERKSVEPMAAVTAPSRVAAQHQSLLHFVGEAPWSDDEVLAKVREQVLPAIERHRPIEAWIIDDTGFAKKGRHSVGVAHQYCGELGQSGNCQVAVSLSIANHHASLPVGYRLYLPKEWAEDRARRKKAGVPEEVVFKTKTAIALDLVQAACVAGIARGVALMDGAYGCDTGLRSGISALGLSYVVGIQSPTTVWPPGCEPLPPKPYVGHGRRPTRLRRDSVHKPVSVKALARGLPEKAWRTIRWREGTNGWLRSRFARVRVRPAHDDDRRHTPRPNEWLLIEWPKGEPAPTRYWLSNLPEDQAALAHRTRLPGTQAGGRARTLRRPRVARLSPSRHALHRRLWIPDLRAGDDSPLRTSHHRAVPNACPSPRSSTPRRRRSDPSVIFQTRSPPCAGD